MARSAYPTGMEDHGGTLRIWLIYKGARMRESLSVSNTSKNRKVAGELRASVCFAIKAGNFSYTAQFPDSPNLKRFGVENKKITVLKLANKWLELKRMEISTNTILRYSSIARNMIPGIGGGKLISAVTQEDLLFIREELLTGYHVLRTGQKAPVKGRSVRTVNNYMRTMLDMLNFAADSGYVKANPFNGISILKRSRIELDLLTREEFVRLISTYTHQQLKNMQSLAVYVGVRHGELISITWRDVDLKAGAMITRHNHILTKEFTLPKTETGTGRIINLVQPAIDVLKNQVEMTRLGRQYQVEVKLREYGYTDVLPFTFVFNPQIISRNSRTEHRCTAGSVNQSWEAAMRRVGIRYRRAYQSRRTYTCWPLAAGAILTSSRSRWVIPTRKWFTGCTDPGWQKTTRTRYPYSTRNRVSLPHPCPMKQGRMGVSIIYHQVM